MKRFFLMFVLAGFLFSGFSTGAPAQAAPAVKAPAKVKGKGKARAKAPAPTPTPIPKIAVSAKEAGITVEPYLQNPTPAGGVTIMWQTAQPAYGWVEFGESEKLGQKQDLVVDGLREANTVTHSVQLSGLKPGRKYYYRIGTLPIKSFAAYKVVFGDPTLSPLYPFKLPEPGKESATVCFFNDLHNKYPVFQALLGPYKKFSPDCVFLNGDCFSEPAGPEDVATALENYGSGIGAAGRPFYYVRGNHDARGAYARQLKPYFANPGGEYYYTATIGPVFFIVLDCGEDKVDSNAEYAGLVDFSGYRKAQAEWLGTVLKSEDFKNAKYRVLVNHIPLYVPGGSKAALADWEPVLKGAPIDLAISAHTHKWKIVKKDEAGNPYPLVIGGGPTLEGSTLTVLQAGPAGIEATLYNDAGVKLDSIAVKK